MIVAEVLGVQPHPNADKLRLVDVDFGGGQIRVVCGAPNVEVGMLAAYAPSGATLPGGFTLERRKIRGEISDGMLCSASESSASATTTTGSSTCDRRRPRSEPTCVRCSGSTT